MLTIYVLEDVPRQLVFAGLDVLLKHFTMTALTLTMKLHGKEIIHGVGATAGACLVIIILGQDQNRDLLNFQTQAIHAAQPE
jgi:hypothetical protein